MNNSQYSSEYNTALAVVGMAGRFPGASSLEQFWHNIANKVSAVQHYSAEELLAAGVKPEDIQQPNYVRAGAVLENIEYFDTSFFGFTPREAEIMDPQFRIFLECVWEALEMAGYAITTFDGLIGIFAGAGYKNYLRHHITPSPKIAKAFSEFQISLGQEQDVLATMVSYKLNLKGPSVAVQSFCSTSLAAVHLACQSLLNYESDLAIAGGVALNSLQKKGYFYEEGQLTSPDGCCRPYDARAQGSVLSNGAGVVVLKRFQDALNDGDHIYCIIRGSAMNNDGNQRVNYTAPGLEGQASVIASAISYAGVHPETITYIEGNGSSTMLGDAIELAAMSRAFASKTQKKQFCGIGSLKSNLGHLDRASGVAGLIKTTLALSHRQLPPHIHYEQPNPEIDLKNSPFYINTNLAPWPRQQAPRRAGVNSFGLGGTNVHLVLEEGPEQQSDPAARSWHLLPISARSAWALQQANSNLVAHLKAHPEQSLADVAYTLQIGRCAFNYRQFVVAQTTEEACAALEQQQGMYTHQERRDRPVAFLFPDADEQYIKVARNLYGQEPVFRETLDRCCQFLPTQMQLALQPLLSPEHNGTEASERAEERRCDNNFPATQLLATFIVEYALAQLLLAWNIRPQVMLGDGPGEYAAACVAGVLSPQDALTILTHRAQFIAEQSESASSLPKDARKALSSVQLHEPRIPYISTVTGTWVTKEQATDPDYWVRQLGQTASLSQRMEAILQGPECVLLEVGAGQAFSSFIKQQPEGQHTQVLPLLTEQADEADLLSALGRLWLAGVTIDWKQLSAPERRLRVWLPTYPFERQRCWIDDPTNLNVIRQRAATAPKEADIADWFYLPYWEPTLPPALSDKQPSDNLCLIFADPHGIGTGIARSLEQAGCPTMMVEAGETFAQRSANRCSMRADSARDYDELFKGLSRSGRIPKTIIHCWSLTKDGATCAHPHNFVRERQTGFFSLLRLARAIGSSIYDAAIRLIVVTNHVQAVTEQDALRPEKALVLGACKVIAQEYPYITCQSIDLVCPDTTSRTYALLAEDLAVECLSNLEERTVAYRGSRRWAQRYLPMRLESAEKAATPFRSRGIYLIIGGLGEIGLLLAEYLATKMQARIVLLDDGSFPVGNQRAAWLENHPADDAVSQRILRLQAMEAMGAQIQVRQANFADAAQMQQTIEQMRQQYGALHGVFYLAGGFDPQTIQDSDLASYEAQFQAKIDNLLALKQALQGVALDFCLLHSSLTGILGGLGCAADAAASALMDVFALQQSQSSPMPWISVNWEPWQTRENERQVSGTTIARFLIAPHEGLEALSRIIASRWTQVIASTGDLHARLQQWVQPLSNDAADRGAVPLNSARPQVSTAYVPPTNPTEQKIVEIWQALLGFEQIGIYDNFFELHGHSLLGMQLISRLRQIFQVNVPLTTLFEDPTVANLAKVVEQLIIEEIEQMDEEEARLLL